MSEVRKGVYTLGDFKELLSKRIAEDGAEGVNMQSDQALELINECLPRNQMLKRLFHEEKDGESIMDTLPIEGGSRERGITTQDV